MPFAIECANWVRVCENDTPDFADTLCVWPWLAKYVNTLNVNSSELLDVVAWRNVLHQSSQATKPWIQVFEEVAEHYNKQNFCTYMHIRWLRVQFRRLNKLSRLQRHLLKAQHGWEQIAAFVPVHKHTKENAKCTSRNLKKLLCFIHQFSALPTQSHHDIKTRALARWVHKHKQAPVIQALMTEYPSAE